MAVLSQCTRLYSKIWQNWTTVGSEIRTCSDFEWSTMSGFPMVDHVRIWNGVRISNGKGNFFFFFLHSKTGHRKRPDFEWIRFSNGRIQDPYCISCYPLSPKIIPLCQLTTKNLANLPEHPQSLLWRFSTMAQAWFEVHMRGHDLISWIGIG